MAAAEGSQRARDPRPGGLRRDRQLPRDLLVGHVLDNAQLQHAALLDRQAAEQLVDTLQPALLGRNTRPVGVLEGPEPLPGAVLQALAPHRLQQHVARDAIQPGRRRPLGLVAERATDAPRLRERLRDEIERRILVVTPAQVITVDPPRVAVIEDAKCSGIVHRGRHQLRVARPQMAHALYMERDLQNAQVSPPACDLRGSNSIPAPARAERGPDRQWHSWAALTEWTRAEHAECYLARQDAIPHRTEGETVLLAHIPRSARRILDLGTGDGRLIALLRLDRPGIEAVGLDMSRPMLEAARRKLTGEGRITLLHHDMSSRLPDIGRFDAAVSCFAIHHLDDRRKRSLYGEVFDLLEPSGVFANLEHVASPSERLHRRFYEAIGYADDWEDPSNKLLDVETQLQWLRGLGFEDVDCYWKWLEMALLIGVKPAKRSSEHRAG